MKSYKLFQILTPALIYLQTSQKMHKILKKTMLQKKIDLEEKKRLMTFLGKFDIVRGLQNC